MKVLVGLAETLDGMIVRAKEGRDDARERAMWKVEAAWAQRFDILSDARAAMIEVDLGEMIGNYFDSSYCDGDKTLAHVAGYGQCVTDLLAHIKKGQR